MATFYPVTNIAAATGNAFSFTADGEAIVVLAGRTLASEQGTAVTGNESSLKVTVLGMIFGHTAGVALGDNAATDVNCKVTIAEGGVVGSSVSQAIRLKGNGSTVENAGTITGLNGISLEDGVFGNMYVMNSGTIMTSGHSIVIGPNSQGYVFVQNFGLISASNTGGSQRAFVDQSAGSNDILVNRGTMKGGLDLGAGFDKFDGRNGLVVGDIDCGAGGDTVDTRGGMVTGTILGKAGIDIFIVGAGEETIDGGSEVDTIDFQGGGAVVVALDGALAAIGFAAGDVYTGIENINGTISGADTLRGNAANNVLFGRGGADSLQGLSGADTLRGGLGVDNCLGGVGDDRFEFQALNECGDKVNDFSSAAAGNNDAFRIKASAFGGGLVAGNAVLGGAQPAAQFITRADNVAQDANDRFILRTTDKTFWFDANGNAAGGLTLVADLQQAATMTAADIILI